MSAIDDRKLQLSHFRDDRGRDVILVVAGVDHCFEASDFEIRVAFWGPMAASRLTTSREHQEVAAEYKGEAHNGRPGPSIALHEG